MIAGPDYSLTAFIHVSPILFDEVQRDLITLRESKRLKEIGVVSFQWHGFDIVVHPRVPDDELRFYDSKGRLLEVMKL